MAEYLGGGSPYPVQHFLGRANWSADVLRDEILRYSREHLTTSGENAALIVDEIGVPTEHGLTKWLLLRRSMERPALGKKNENLVPLTEPEIQRLLFLIV